MPARRVPTSTVSKPIPSKKRQILPRAVRREQLILATMRCIARLGLSSVTLSQVTKEAGLSQGIANLHFAGKEDLLVETLRFVTGEYNRGQVQILKDPAFGLASERLAALVAFQFSRSVTEETKMAVWFAFYGEAKSRPTYKAICAQADARAARLVRQLFADVAQELGRPIDSVMVAEGYIALIDGLWLSLLLAPKKMTRAKAKRVAWTHLNGIFLSL